DTAVSVDAQGELSLLTEPLLARKFWQKRVRDHRDGAEGAKELARFAIRLGDLGQLSLQEGADDSPTRTYLYEDRLLEIRDNGRVAFTQDIYGRWARF